MAASIILSICFFFAIFGLDLTMGASNQISQEILDKILDESGYDTSIQSEGLDPNLPLEVQIQLQFRYLNYLDDKNQLMGVQFVLRLFWYDPRHRYEEEVFEGTAENKTDFPDYILIADASRIWYPDVFVRNEKNSYHHEVIKPNTLIRIHKNGTTYLSTRITATVYCPMDLKWYPFDQHLCPIQLSFFSLNSLEAKLTWHPEQELLSWGDKTHLPMFELLNMYQKTSAKKIHQVLQPIVLSLPILNLSVGSPSTSQRRSYLSFFSYLFPGPPFGSTIEQLMQE